MIAKLPSFAGIAIHASMGSSNDTQANAISSAKKVPKALALSPEEIIENEFRKSHVGFLKNFDHAIIEESLSKESFSEHLNDVRDLLYKKTHLMIHEISERESLASIFSEASKNGSFDRLFSFADISYNNYGKKAKLFLSFLEQYLSINFIEDFDNRNYKATTYSEKLSLLEDFAVRNGGVGVSNFAKMLFPELEHEVIFPQSVADKVNNAYSILGEEAFLEALSRATRSDTFEVSDNGISPDAPPKIEQGVHREGVLPLPDAAPEIYQGLRGPETPPAFVQRVYGPWLGHGLDRAHIRHLDPKLSAAIDNWMSRPGNEWPAEVDLPTRSEQNRRVVERLRAQAPDGDINKVIGSFTMREAERLRSAAKRTK